MMTDSDIIIEAEDYLWQLGLEMCGKSNASRSTYWGASSRNCNKALRLSDHDVAYASSDCPVCVGTEQCQDVDLVLRTGEDWKSKLKTWARKAIEAAEINEDDIENEAYHEERSVEEVRAEKQDWVRKHFPKLYD